MLNMLLLRARKEVAQYGRIKADTAAKLMGLGVIVGPLEARLIHEVGDNT